ncbi:MAG: C4-dicarboxylate TRAP transporter large permease protein DctM [Alphaproteobacteria bacterium MarineAlpha11_Bin1]|mgnify:CR=1 FL=1|nr:MAG: C4-dicarboxylate TRAP transporter large permease protein DctM [Alphaproteobacteria bacterium MarineAlpha11_Bin1]|tara:strand:- start:1915 stop:3804 length:1890 start_codon:yes stop_codon:yes gene_type:complete
MTQHIKIARGAAALMTAGCLIWNLDFLTLLDMAPIEETFQAFVLGLALTVTYLTIGITRKSSEKLPWYDLILSVFTIILLLYVSLNYLRLKEEGFANSTNEVIFIGAILSFLVLEGLRRSAGYVLLGVVGVFLIYAPLAHMVPGSLVGLNLPLWQIGMNLGFNPNAIFGAPLVISTTIVIMFILMGQVLLRAGGSEFFTDLAMATMGRRRGGAAKISVMASALFGTISGAAVSNVVVTGVVTIPLMRDSGYKATHAGAIEAIASTGGQMMPPIMGAAAFLMAETLEILYAEIVIAALLPSIIYYFAAYIQVDLIAARDDISAVNQEIPKLKQVLKEGWYFIPPFAVLIYLLFWANQPAAVAAVWAAAVLIVSGAIFSYKGRRIRLEDLYEILAETGLVTINLIMIVAAAGIVIGVLNMTGLGLALPTALISIAGDNLAVLLIIAAVVCIVLGMGMPTTAVYILLSALIAPAIIEAGVDDVPAHMFILYFGMMSMITPPIALAAFAAATLTKADPMTTGFVAMRFGWTAYVVPFLFVISPSLLLLGDDNLQIAIDAGTALVGVYLISVAAIGYFRRQMGWPPRILLILLGVAAMIPDQAVGFQGIADIAGCSLGILALTFLAMSSRNSSS